MRVVQSNAVCQPPIPRFGQKVPNFLVQAILMLEYGVITSGASRNMPGYDLIAHNLENKTDCKISVKYRKAEDCDGFQFTRTDDFDFFVGIIWSVFPSPRA
jgi:hypothetical protein